jgi:hypothetical protein
VVERVDRAPNSSGRLRLRLRLENNSDQELRLTPGSFAAVDSFGIHYDADQHASDWPDDDTDLAAGQRELGDIVLAEKLASGATSLDVTFNVAVGDYWPDRYITVLATAAVPDRSTGDTAGQTSDNACD